MAKPIKVLSLFSGVGGLDWGFHKSPQAFSIVFANDFNKDASATYRKNFNDPSYFIEGDIKEHLGVLPDCNLVIGGFPCQPYSLIGLRKGLQDPRAIEVYSFATTLINKRPEYFIAENVKGILSHNKGETLKTILDLFKDCGYNVAYSLIKMNEYGVPQRRERVLFFGVRNDLPLDPKKMIPAPTTRGDNLEIILTRFKDKEFNVNNHNLHTGTEAKKHWLKVLLPGENISKLTEEEIRKREDALGIEHRKIPKTITGYRRLRGDEVAPTMMFGNTCLPMHPSEARDISVREAAAIQSFPDDFIFCGGIAAQYKQIGNAVPPLFSEILANHLAEVL